MPDGDDPHRILVEAIEKPVWSYDYFTERKIGKLRNDPSGFRECLQPGQLLLCLPAEV
jgi:hypothetical protein